jgi:hypothetical protein
MPENPINPTVDTYICTCRFQETTAQNMPRTALVPCHWPVRRSVCMHEHADEVGTARAENAMQCNAVQRIRASRTVRLTSAAACNII